MAHFSLQVVLETFSGLPAYSKDRSDPILVSLVKKIQMNGPLWLIPKCSLFRDSTPINREYREIFMGLIFHGLLLT